MINNEILRVAEERYGIKGISSVEKLDILSTNALYRIKSKQGVFLMKKLFENDLKEGNVRSQIEIAEHLHKKDIPVMLPVKNSDEDFLTFEGNSFFMLYPFISIDAPSDEHFGTAVKTLYDFHSAMEDFEERFEFWTRPMHTETIDITNFTQYHERLKREPVESKLAGIKTPFAEKVRKDSIFIKKCIQKVMDELKDAKFTKQTVLHFDYKKDNLFFSNGKLAAVSDFDYSHRGFVETDVAKSARYCAEKDDATIDIRKFRKFIEEYSGYSGISIDWKTYHMLAVYTVLRRIVHAAHKTLDNAKNLESLYDYDMKLLRFLMENEKEFRT